MFMFIKIGQRRDVRANVTTFDSCRNMCAGINKIYKPNSSYCCSIATAV